VKGVAALLITGLLAGCSSNAIDSNALAAAPPANHRQRVADQLSPPVGVSLAGAQISSLSRSVGGQLGDWATCLKVNAPGKARYFAVFLTEIVAVTPATTEKAGDKRYTIEARESVLSDRCELAVYDPLPAKTPPPKPAKSREPASGGDRQKQ